MNYFSLPSYVPCIASNFILKRSGEGWEHVEHISITRDLASDINYFLSIKGSDAVAHIRALSFSYPQKQTMEDFANSWRFKVQDVGRMPVNWGKVPKEPTEEVAAASVSDNEFDEDDEDMDDDELDDYLQMMAETRAVMQNPNDTPLFVDVTGLSGIEPVENAGVVSPFAQTDSEAPSTPQSLVANDQPLELNSENVDKVLDEVRPYLISDGGKNQ